MDAENLTDAPIRVPTNPDRVTFAPEDGSPPFYVDLLDVIDFLDQTRDELKKKPGARRYDLLEAIQQYIAGHNPGVLVSLSVCDWINDHVAALYLKKKSERSIAIGVMLGLPDSTESTPSD